MARFKKGVKGIKFTQPITNSDGTPYDLTGLTPTLYAKDDNGNTITMVGTAVGDPTAGNAQFTVGTSDFATVADNDAEIEMTDGGGTLIDKTETFPLNIEAAIH